MGHTVLEPAVGGSRLLPGGVVKGLPSASTHYFWITAYVVVELASKALTSLETRPPEPLLAAELTFGKLTIETILSISISMDR